MGLVGISEDGHLNTPTAIIQCNHSHVVSPSGFNDTHTDHQTGHQLALLIWFKIGYTAVHKMLQLFQVFINRVPGKIESQRFFLTPQALLGTQPPLLLKALIANFRGTFPGCVTE